METALVLYAISVLPNLAAIFGIIAMLGFIAGIISLAFELVHKPHQGDDELINSSKNKDDYSFRSNIYKAFERREIYTPAKAIRRVALIPSICILFLASLVPGERSLWLIAGGYVAQEAVTSEIGQDMIDVIRAKVNQYKEEITGEQQ